MRKEKNRLRRPCKKCGIYFKPTGRGDNLCLDCFSHRFDSYRKNKVEQK